MTALEHLHAVLVFTSEFHSERRVGLRMAKERLPKLTNHELDEFLAQTEKDIQVRVKALKPRLPLSFYAEFLRDVPIALDQWLFLPKWRMKQWFGVMENALSALPEHSLLSFDLHGIDPPGTRGEVRILEASLFEDMCALFNRGWDLSPVAAARQSKPVIKECAACRRGAVLAAFYMIEAYLNSIAYDYLVANARKGPSDDMDKITEWDHKRDKQKLVSFRDKLLTYPRIILGVEHPPLQENNCPEMQFLLDDSKLFRDAIVHANPRTGNSPITERSKELYFWRIGSVTPVAFGKGTQLYSGEVAAEQWVKIIDSAITLIEKLERVIHSNTERLFWLQKRTEAGPFDLSVFD